MTLPIDPLEWIILDTNIVRALIEGEAGRINVEELRALRGDRRIACADALTGEMVFWLQQAPDETIQRVKPALETLSPLLDSEFPIAPGPSDLAAFAGLVLYSPGRDRTEIGLFLRAFWRNLTMIESREDLRRDLRYRDSSGNEVVKHFQGPQRDLKAMEDGWIDNPIAEITKQFNYPELTEEDARRLRNNIRAAVARELNLPSGSPGADRLELHVEYMLQRLLRASTRHYQPPKPSSNPAVDATLTYYMMLPAVVCTADRKFIRSVRSLKSPDRFRILLPDELFVWLRTGRLPS